MNALRSVELDDKYALDDREIYLTGTQALVRLMLVQAERDRISGLRTAGFVSGYRGSPVAAVDQQMWIARSHLESNRITFHAGLNEDLAATSIWGTQQANLWPGAKVDGVFSLWYGKGPGVDRTGDVFKHANNYGTSRHGGVLAVAGDDHACKTTTVAAQNDLAFAGHSMPVLVPGNVEEIIEFGLHGFAASRFSGLWMAFKVLADVIDTSASIDGRAFALKINTPNDFHLPSDGLNIRLNEHYDKLDERIQRYKLPAFKAYVRANRLDRLLIASAKPRIGIVSVGKTAYDVLQVLKTFEDIDPRAIENVALLKLAASWPIDDHTIREFAAELDEIVIVEDRLPIIEQQVRSILYNVPRRPIVVGKRDENGTALFKEWSDISTAEIALTLADRLRTHDKEGRISAHVAKLNEHLDLVSARANGVARKPYFCSGCPHNRSTKVVEGSRAIGGIGCHYISTWVEGSRTDVFTQMGGEGVVWIGQSLYRNEEHIFANLGDGTYFHSGILAVRALVAAERNVTYKLLFNGAVAMTGGQPIDGVLTVPQVTFQLAAERVNQIAVVSEDVNRYVGVALAPGVSVHSRRELPDVEARFRNTKGVTVIIYDQTCATEKRRRRKRGALPEAQERVFINDRVCEGCGDCSAQSNCVSIVPLETEFGTKRAIDQSNCNADFSCTEGFCPSFVSLPGAKRRKRSLDHLTANSLPAPPTYPSLNQPFGMVITGIGGTGVVTAGAILGMAAHLEGKAVTVLDSLGFSQKGGGVTSQIRIGAAGTRLASLKVPDGSADLLLACDNLLAANADVLKRVGRGRTHAVVNSHEQVTPAFIHDPDFRNPTAQIRRSLHSAIGLEATFDIDANRLAEDYLGDAIAANMILVGYAWQKGLLPLGRDAVLAAISLNGTSVALNEAAFAIGRQAAHSAQSVVSLIPTQSGRTESLETIVSSRTADLTAYQDRAYADLFVGAIERLRASESSIAGQQGKLTIAAARNLHKLMAYKDEYEVARLYADPTFHQKLHETFENIGQIKVHLAPPLLSRRDPLTRRPRKTAFGSWMFTAMRILAKGKWLRATSIDPFGWTAERKADRKLWKDYLSVVDEVSEQLTPDNYSTALALLSLPDRIRGFGHVRERSISLLESERVGLLAEFRNSAPTMVSY